MRRLTSRHLNAIGAHQLDLLIGFGGHVHGVVNVLMNETVVKKGSWVAR
jgi:hypothetical protein